MCQAYCASGDNSLPAGVWEESMRGLKLVEEAMGAKLGDKENPLLLSVRSGAAVSMPGMMDTVSCPKSLQSLNFECWRFAIFNQYFLI